MRWVILLGLGAVLAFALGSWLIDAEPSSPYPVGQPRATPGQIVAVQPSPTSSPTAVFLPWTRSRTSDYFVQNPCLAALRPPVCPTMAPVYAYGGK